MVNMRSEFMTPSSIRKLKYNGIVIAGPGAGVFIAEYSFFISQQSRYRGKAGQY